MLQNPHDLPDPVVSAINGASSELLCSCTRMEHSHILSTSFYIINDIKESSLTLLYLSNIIINHHWRHYTQILYSITDIMQYHHEFRFGINAPAEFGSHWGKLLQNCKIQWWKKKTKNTGHVFPAVFYLDLLHPDNWPEAGNLPGVSPTLTQVNLLSLYHLIWMLPYPLIKY